MAQSKLIVREVRPREIDDMLKLRNSIFGHISRTCWDAMGCTAVVAKRGKGFCGAIPLRHSNFAINPHVSVPVAFENAVGVAQGARGKGVGTAMLDCAADFMRDRVDALYVYRGEERTPGYRFYRKTGHGDLYYHTTLTLNEPKGRDNNVEVLDVADAVALEKALLALYKSCWGGFGGYWKRSRGYFDKLLATCTGQPRQWKLLLQRTRAAITGYAIVDTECPWYPGHCIYDFAAATPATREAILARIEWLANRAGRPVSMPTNCEHPMFHPLLKRRYVPNGNTPYIMGRILRPDRIFARLARSSPLLEALRLDAVTPHRNVAINHPARPKHVATLYLKESQLTRLLSCRLDLAGALATNLIRMSPVPARVTAMLSRVLRFWKWVSFSVDLV